MPRKDGKSRKIVSRAKRVVEEAQAFALEEATHRVRSLESEIRDLKRELARVQRNEDLILRSVRDALAQPWDLRLPSRPKPDRRRRKLETHAILIGDTQVGKTTPTYDVAKAEQRILEAAQSAIDIAVARRQWAVCNEIRVYLLGDAVEGEIIFPAQPFEIEMGVYDQAVKACPEIYAKAILRLREFYRVVKVRAVVGNHGRVVLINIPSSPRTSWDRVAFDVTKMLVQKAAPEIEFLVSDDFYYVDRLPGGWGVMLVHGDQIQGKGTSGALERAVEGWVEAIPEPFDYVAMGHFHRASMWAVHGRHLIMNASTESPDSGYVRARVKVGGYPSQWFLVFDEHRGLIDQSLLYLDERRPRG